MADYGRPVAFGFFLNPDTVDYAKLVRTARLAWATISVVER
jgi:hypothetical protein